jgi:transposase
LTCPGLKVVGYAGSVKGQAQSHIEKEQVMHQCTTYVGLDVHKDSIWAALATSGREVIELGRIENTPAALGRLVQRLQRKHPTLHFVYEAGPCGYDLHRQLLSLGQTCQVVAPSLMPRRPGDRIKTDRRDSLTLARLARSGDLVSVWVPDERHEAVRELVRCRQELKGSERRCRQRLLSLLVRHGRRWEAGHWTQAHGAWLRRQRFEQIQTQQVFEHYLHAMMECQERIVQVERQMQEALEGWSLSPLVDGLMAMRGVKLMTGMTLAAELGELSRFDSPQQLMAFVGLVPSERSSGCSRRQGHITKSGNARVRRVLVESMWSYRHRPSCSPALRKRAARASQSVQAIAWKAQKRLHGRYHRLVLRGKPPQQAITAVAREAVGFVWAIAMQVAEEQRALAAVSA